MALQQNGGPAPYGPPSGVTAVVEAYRNRGLQTPLTPDVLIRAGVTEALAPRVFQSLRLLDLVDEAGNPSDELKTLRLAPSEELQSRFASIVLNAYAPIFAFANPSHDSPERVRDAFRPYEPVGQQGRMVTLFLGLCEYAGIIEGRPVAAPRPQSPRPRAESRNPRPNGRVRADGESGVTPGSAGLPEAILALLRQALPKSGTWTTSQRERFLQTFKAVLDFSVEVNDSAPIAGGPDTDA